MPAASRRANPTSNIAMTGELVIMPRIRGSFVAIPPAFQAGGLVWEEVKKCPRFMSIASSRRGRKTR
jgi:hypothetical protein